ncbi:MAG: trimethylamine methyltransferase family protein, partial [Rhodobacteraceae bacterium]|nr:trimethylamine methyltransferase family protein [Paracoccaceae bacterium]
TRRAGGRSARRALRAAPLADDLRPVRAGMEGGRYRPLSDNDIERIHASVLDVLEQIGISQATPSCIEACTLVGAEYRDGRMYFPRSLIEHTIKTANRDFTIFARDPKHDIRPQGAKVHFGTAGAAVHVVDVERNEYRESYLVDIYDAARIVELQDNIHFFQRPMVARDMENDYKLDLNTLYACLSGTTKHVGVSFTVQENVADGLEMMYKIAGGEDAFRARPFVSASVCFVVPPLRFAKDACDVMEKLIEGGVPILLLSAGQAGATSPAAIAGAVVQAVAEVLAGLVYVNALKPGHPAIFGPWPFVSDLRTGAMSGGSGEQALLTAACGQMANFYGLVGGSPAGMSDAKMPDVQAGYEKGITTAMAGLAGANIIYEAAGMHGSLMGFCLESLIIDNDILGQSLRCVRGIDINDDTLSVDTMKAVCLGGPEHYLGQPQTLNLMETEYIYPKIADRLSPKEWEVEGKPKMVQKAIIEKRRILDTHFPRHISDELDAELRQQFDIKLPRSAMRQAPSS